MDIIEELKLIKQKDYETAYDYTIEQLDIWKKKLHLIKVVKVMNEVEKAVVDGSLKNCGVVSLVFSKERDEQYYFLLKAYDAEDNTIQRITKSGLTKPEFQNISFALTDLSGFEFKHTGEQKSVTLTLDKSNVRTELSSLLLSSELRNILNYSEMQLEISNNEPTNSNKKLKV